MGARRWSEGRRNILLIIGGVFKTPAEGGSRRREEADVLEIRGIRLLTSAATSRF
jgi:hypothetical protein